MTSVFRLGLKVCKSVSNSKMCSNILLIFLLAGSSIVLEWSAFLVSGLAISAILKVKLGFNDLINSTLSPFIYNSSLIILRKFV